MSSSKQVVRSLLGTRLLWAPSQSSLLLSARTSVSLRQHSGHPFTFTGNSRNNNNNENSENGLTRLCHSASLYLPASVFVRHQSSSANADTSYAKTNNQHDSILYRTTFNDPLKHENHHLSKYYRIEQSELEQIDPLKETLSPEFFEKFQAFNETCLMIRKPAMEIINYMRRMDLSLPAYRFVLYGLENGTGKRSTLLHLLHYCWRDNWLIVHLPNCSKVLRKANEMQPSVYKEGRVDTPFEAEQFITRFAIQNAKLLTQLNLKTTKVYNWAGKDSSPIGTPLLELIEYAKTRIKYASDICGAIIREIKCQSSKKKYKVFVCIEQMNSYFGPTRLKRIDKSEITPDDITIVRNFKKMLKNDWTNAVVVGTVGNVGVIIPGPNRRSKFYDTSIPVAIRRRVACTLHYEGPLTPAHLLKKEGFYYLEPFVPIEVPAYSDAELASNFNYYKDRHWLQNPAIHTDEGRAEIKFLCGSNPAQFMRVCEPL